MGEALNQIKTYLEANSLFDGKTDTTKKVRDLIGDFYTFGITPPPASTVTQANQFANLAEEKLEALKNLRQGVLDYLESLEDDEEPDLDSLKKTFGDAEALLAEIEDLHKKTQVIAETLGTAAAKSAAARTLAAHTQAQAWVDEARAWLDVSPNTPSDWTTVTTEVEIRGDGRQWAKLAPNGNLYLNFSDANENISFNWDANAGTHFYSVNGGPRVYIPSELKGLFINAKGGNDVIDFYRNNDFGDIPITVLLGDGNDTFRGSLSAETVVGGAGVDTIWTGGGGGDVIDVSGDDTEDFVVYGRPDKPAAEKEAGNIKVTADKNDWVGGYDEPEPPKFIDISDLGNSPVPNPAHAAWLYKKSKTDVTRK